MAKDDGSEAHKSRKAMNKLVGSSALEGDSPKERYVPIRVGPKFRRPLPMNPWHLQASEAHHKVLGLGQRHRMAGSISFLGSLMVVVNAQNWPIEPLPKMQSVLAYLAINRERWVSRREIALKLWPLTEEEQSRANLRKVLHQIRQDRTLSILIDERTKEIRWAPAIDLTLDIALFEACVFHHSTEALEHARHLYRGPLLPLVEDEWIQPERERLHRLHAEVLQRLATRYLSQGLEEEALMLCSQLVEIDPFNEEYRRLCLRVHGSRNDLSSLQNAFDQMVLLFQTELGVKPTKETFETFQSLKKTLESTSLTVDGLKKQTLRTPPTPSVPHFYVPRSPQDDLATEAFVDWIIHTSGTPVFYLWAPPGAGKTTWLHAVSKIAAEKGWHVSFESPPSRRSLPSHGRIRKNMFFVDENEQRFMSWAGYGNPVENWTPNVRMVLSGTMTPGTLWGPSTNWTKWARAATLEPISPEIVLDWFYHDCGFQNPTGVEEIISLTGGLPRGVDQAIRLWKNGIRNLSANEQWHRISQNMADSMREVAKNALVDPQILKICSLIQHIEPWLLEELCHRVVSDAEYRRLAESGLFVVTAQGLALRGEVRRVISREFQTQQPLEAARIFQQVIRLLVCDWDVRSKAEKERIARECITAIREYLRINPEGYLLPVMNLDIMTAREEDYPAMYRVVKYYLTVEQIASSSQIFGEWNHLVSDPYNRVRVAKDHHGDVLGFSVAIPLNKDSLDFLGKSRTTEVLARSLEGSAEQMKSSHGWVLRMVAYGPQRRASVLALLEEDLLSLFGTASAFYVATPLNRYHRLLSQLGFTRLPGAARWNNGKLRVVENYVLDLSAGFPAWIEKGFTGLWT